MSIDLLPQSMHQAFELLPEPDLPVVLFTRHSIRELTAPHKIAGYDLQLTEQGRELAYAWGNNLSAQTNRQISSCISSPIQRCMDTAALMLKGAYQLEMQAPFIPYDIQQKTLLVEPGSYVLDMDLAAPYFHQYGAIKFIDQFVQNQIPGMKQPTQGVLDILKLLHEQCPEHHSSLSLAVSHDTILAALVSVLSQRFQVHEYDWPEMMEGLFMWFDDPDFMQSGVHWIWRGKKYSTSIQSIQTSSY